MGSGPRTAWFLHGILGSGRNWRSFAARWLTDGSDWTAVLPDLRHHGASHDETGPDTLAAVAGDLHRELPRPDAVFGHSFGGKVALVWARDHGHGHERVVALDSPPGGDRPGTDPASDPVRVLEVLRSTPAHDRAAARAHLAAAGFAPSIVDWLLTSLVRDGNVWRWTYNLDGIEALLNDYFATDLRPLIDVPRDTPLHFVRAGLSDRWDPETVRALEASRHVRYDVVPNAGHWLHVERPDAVRELLRP